MPASTCRGWLFLPAWRYSARAPCYARPWPESVWDGGGCTAARLPLFRSGPALGKPAGRRYTESLPWGHSSAGRARRSQ
ncbi:protein of unknown function [Stenotrophomonas maltophilia]|nr:protein of unknown function [Stenotrophomonas maltophilia]